MELIHIVPIHNLQFYDCLNIVQGVPTSVMCLTHLVEKYPEYCSYFRNYPGYKILDNSLIELGGSVSIERVVRAADAIRADEIILPDVFKNGPETMRAVAEALTWLSEHGILGKYKLMAVCQGRDARSFGETFNALKDCTQIDVVGIPKVCAQLHPAGRPYFEYLWKYSSAVIHLLGVWYSWEELLRVDQCRIRSVDSCLLTYQSSYNLPETAVRPDGHTVLLESICADTDDLLRRQAALDVAPRGYGKTVYGALRR